MSALAMPRLAHAQATRTLKFTPYTDLVTLDPVVTGNYAVRNHALMVFDTLYGVDDTYMPHPQMVAGHITDADGRVWTLRLRDGLRFHDGEPVLARDAVASIRRWGQRDVLGAALMAVTDELSTPDDRTIRFRLKAPFPLLPYALGKTQGNVMIVMPERLAASGADKPVSEMVGSGPYRYLAAERLQGAFNAYAKFEGYVPRGDGPAQLLAGPKIANFDRVEWHTLPDAATAAAALEKGEIDWWEQPITDYWPVLRSKPGIVLDVLDRSGIYRYARVNHLNPPFDKAAVRRAALAAVSQTDVVVGIAGDDPSMSRTGIGFFAPDSRMASNVGMEGLKDPPDRDAVRRLLDASGYNGETVAMMSFGTIPALDTHAQVVADAWQRCGFKVDFQPLETAAALQRLGNQGPLAKGGWSASTDSFAGVTANDPALIDTMRTTGSTGTYGWADIPEIVELRARYLTAADLVAQQSICRELQAVCYREVPYIPSGITLQPTAYSRTLTNVRRGVPLFYGVART